MICDKIAYEIYKDALTHVKGLSKRKKGKYKAYKCDKCEKFHITTINKTFLHKDKCTKYKLDKNKFQKVKNPKMPEVNPNNKNTDNQKSIQTTYKPFEYLLNKKS